MRVPAPSLVPLGLVVTKDADSLPVTADFAGLAEPAEFFPSLKTWGISGEVVSLNESFKDLPAGRYQVRWDGKKFIENLEARFPKAKDHSEYAAIKAEFEAKLRLQQGQINDELGAVAHVRLHGDAPCDGFREGMFL